MILYLVRHGEAVPETGDSQRKLSPKGRDDVARVSADLKRRGAAIEAFWHSSKARARETAGILRDVLAPGRGIEEKGFLSPDDPPGSAAREIRDLRRDLLIVSHIPFLPRLVSLLVTDGEDKNIVHMPTAAVVVLEGAAHQPWTITAVITPSGLSHG
ncbi:MAG: histidine phosphatase family protein [Candidatus Omnitrophota bacterium]|nr:histidine phosphatase family protein [Candidatus Omnitrophota bacterium]MDZ4241711.1 histidine phosphatase family protein [Candidatus Omnitrophota bacterium]